jgi:hypothetical protein|tara:strand:+ start:194 stop:712 length:519 start_codon:yes stop_codon:yes gene_type:complete
MMGKRSDFERKPRDFYPTPMEAVKPLLEHLPKDFTFAEPCAGNGALIEHLETKGICMWASDIEPQADGIHKNDYSNVGFDELIESEYVITNPPWDRKILHPMIEYFSPKIKTWLLFDADWMHTKQSVPYMAMCIKIVSVGRIKWFGNMTGKDNCAWYLFDKKVNNTIFYGRT